LRKHCLVKHIIEGKIEGKIKVTEKRDRRRKLLPDDFTETTGYWKLNKEALDCTFWRNCFGRFHGSLVKPNTVKPVKLTTFIR
jgi:hypothetical protein